MMILSTLNALVINLAIVISVTLGLYFYSLKHSLKNDNLNTDFLTIPINLDLPKQKQIISGILIGLMAFIISNHGIPIADFRPVDVRYLPVYFSVYYGSPLIGAFTAITLIIAKCIQYVIIEGTISEFLHNILITLFILIISIIIKNKKISPKNGIILCLILTLIIRSIFFILIFYPHFTFSIVIQILINFAIFSLFFLFTGWLIHRAIVISEGIHVYRTSSIFDGLTGLYNKESFYFFLDLAYNEAISDGRPFSLAIIDLDDFKSINDSYGHLKGDKILETVAHLLKKELDPNSRIRVCRIGGDEFAIIFKHEIYNTSDFFDTVFENLRHLEIDDSIENQLSLSVGLIDFNSTTDIANSYVFENAQNLYDIADKALYEAKEQGKNPVIPKHIAI